MISQGDTYLPHAPQSGRTATMSVHDDDHAGLWSQMLAVFRDIGGSFDPFANDAHEEVRALGRAARQRRQPHSDDYFALGDLCARLIDVARSLGSYDALKAAALACERVQQLDLVARKPADRDSLRETVERLREQMRRASESNPAEAGDAPEAVRASSLLCDQGRMLLRQSQTSAAFELFERALQLDEGSHAAWLWRAMALTDMGRFDDALASYDRALALDPDNARVWNSKGALLTELGRAEAALTCLDRALALSSSDAKVKAIFWLNKGKALFILKRYREAREALVRSYQFDPSPESAAGIAACREQIELSATSPAANPT